MVFVVYISKSSQEYIYNVYISRKINAFLIKLIYITLYDRLIKSKKIYKFSKCYQIIRYYIIFTTNVIKIS